MVNIYLIGFMGAGKTSVGARLAELLDADFRDLDHEVSRRFGCSIREVFLHHGEAVFRAAETEELRRLSGQKGLVVATGGGAFSSETNRSLIEESRGISVFLDLPWEVLESRLAADGAGRPMYRDAEQSRRLHAERLTHYRRATVTLTLSGEESPDEVAGMIGDAVRGAPCAI